MAFSSLPYSMRFSSSILSAMLGCQRAWESEALRRVKEKDSGLPAGMRYLENVPGI